MGDPAWEVTWEDTGWVRSGFCGLAWTLALEPLGNSGFQGLPLELWGKAWLSCPTWPVSHLPFYFQARSPSGRSQPWRELKRWGEEGSQAPDAGFMSSVVCGLIDVFTGGLELSLPPPVRQRPAAMQDVLSDTYE